MWASVMEGFLLCFVLLLVCVINIRNGPVGGVHYYEPPVKQRVVELGLITQAQIKKNRRCSALVLFGAILILSPLMVFTLNGARSFREGFAQLAVQYLICWAFDRVFIDWYWVGHTKAWIIPGTEDLMPYIHPDSWIKKIFGSLILYLALAALASWICTVFLV